MALDDVLAGLGGALKGGLANYSWQKDYQQKDRKITEDNETRRLVAEVRAMLAMDVEDGRNARHATPSANVLTQQAAATERTGMTTNTQRDIAGDRNVTANRAIDVNEAIGLRRDETTRIGQNLNFTLGGMRDATSRRGQDVGASTTRRGQDFAFTLGTSAETGRTTRAGDANALREDEAEKNRALEREKMKHRGAGALDFLTPKIPDATRELIDGTGRPTATPIEVPDPPSDDLPPVRSPEAQADEMTRLEAQAKSLLQQFQREGDPARKAALGAQLQRLRAQYEAAKRKGP